MYAKLTKPMSFVACSRFLFRSPILLALLLCLSSASLARADAVYSFSLPANGAVSAFSFQLTVPFLLPPGFGSLALTNPMVTSFSFTTPGLVPSQSVIGIQVSPTATFIGVSLRDAAFQPLLFTTNAPADFFSFPRLPLETGTFLSTSGNVVSILPLDTNTPVGTLTVTTTPEPTTALLVVSGLSMAGLITLRRRE